MGVGRWVAAEKPVGRSAKCYKFTYRFRLLGVVVTIRYTHLGAPGSIPFRTGEKDLKKRQKRRLFFFLATGKFAQNPVGRSARPPLGIRAALPSVVFLGHLLGRYSLEGGAWRRNLSGSLENCPAYGWAEAKTQV